MTTPVPPAAPDDPQSPCVNICVIHPQEGICVGCYRTLHEIAAWSVMDADSRREVIQALPDRKPLLKKRRGGRNGRRPD